MPPLSQSPRWRKQRGVAMMMALVTMTIMTILVAELVYETEVYHRIVYNGVDQLRTQYLAKSGLKIARLQVHAANLATQKLKQLGKGVPIRQSDVDRIWSTPLILPPPVPDSAGIILKNKVNELTEELGLDGTISVSISGESSKLNLNRLVWTKEPKKETPRARGNNNSEDKDEDDKDSDDQDPNNLTEEEKRLEALKVMRETIIESMEQLLTNRRETDEEFLLKYERVTGAELVGNIIAWMDPDTLEDGEGIPKESYYRDQRPPYSIKNAPLYSISELRMIKGFDDQLVDFLANNYTTLLTEGLNVNRIDKGLIEALFPNIEEEDVERFIEHREEFGFDKIEDFWKYMQEELGFGEEDKKQFEEQGIDFVTTETAYRVVIEARSGLSRNIWLAYLGLTPPDLTVEQKGPEQIDPNDNQVGQDDNNDNQDGDGQQNTTPVNDKDVPAVVYLRTG